MTDGPKKLFDDLVSEIAGYGSGVDLDLVTKAYEFSREAHGAQKRKSGEPFVCHSISVAKIIADLIQARLDTIIVSSALLHDVIEDTSKSIKDVDESFGSEIASIVDGVTKISRYHLMNPEKGQVENFRKMLFSMARDLRVIFLKLADRLHNMRTLEFLEAEKIKRISMETLEIYAPLAHMLGIAEIKRELEDLSFKFLYQSEYRELAATVAEKREEREKYLDEVKEEIAGSLAREGVKAEIVARPKHFYSIYRKMHDQGRRLEDIFDLQAARVITNDKADCYRVLGIIHDLFTPVQDRFKDFIAAQKGNLYQSLHTTVVGPRGRLVEIQIRTKEMHLAAERGFAAHYGYKGGKIDKELLEKLGGFVVDMQELGEIPDAELMELLKVSLYQDDVFVVTPKGDLKKLPRGGTPIDFAYLIHTEVGNRCVGAKVNGSIVPLRFELKSGDRVEIITSPTGRPREDWLHLAKTSSARGKIRHWLRLERQKESIGLGKEILEREMRKHRLKLGSEDELLDAAQSLDCNDIQGLYARIGQGEVSPKQVLQRLFPEWKEKKTPGPLDKLRELVPGKARGVRIHGLDNLMISFAKCCQPVPGDKVTGIITRGRGVSIHRIDCPNSFEDRVGRERMVSVEWDAEKEDSFVVSLLVVGGDRQNLLAGIAKAISSCGSHIRTVSLGTVDGVAKGRFFVEVKNLRHLNDVAKEVRKVAGVSSVEREQFFPAPRKKEAHE
ncbi:MAG: bifunctional (p)ppGpp synthetase/guanosine-3',5'-bis(diphosphate) 3'-pyrophosphohydrolase [Candidatus Eisenbacteria bacterium]|nr:bifunctional (p)ppGpp synthetase/guanosine-3',5'-bis(diphosphate) 3'-pyrophosphohydrolase [Candidatus Eisenbacteria bacterium]